MRKCKSMTEKRQHQRSINNGNCLLRWRMWNASSKNETNTIETETSRTGCPISRFALCATGLIKTPDNSNVENDAKPLAKCDVSFNAVCNLTLFRSAILGISTIGQRTSAPRDAIARLPLSPIRPIRDRDGSTVRNNVKFLARRWTRNRLIRKLDDLNRLK